MAAGSFPISVWGRTTPIFMAISFERFSCRAPMVALSYAQVKSGGPSVARIDLVDVNKTLREPGGRGSTFSIQNLSLRVPDGRTLVILGPSGCGKTTLLKIIAGLIPPDSGRIRYNGVDVRDVAPGERKIGMVFQSYALYPHMDGRANILSYFIFRKKTPALDALKAEKYRRTSELMGV